jgi:hypothetical protein
MKSAELMDVPGVGFKFPYLSSPEVTFGLTISEIEAENSFSGWFTSVTGGSSQFYGINVDGFMASTVHDPRYVSWGLDSNYAYFDTTVDATYIPETHYEFLMGELMLSSIGFYFDADLKRYVTSCDQYTIIPDLYIRFNIDDQTEVINGQWYGISALDYLKQIDVSGYCTVNLVPNPDN